MKVGRTFINQPVTGSRHAASCRSDRPDFESRPEETSIPALAERDVETRLHLEKRLTLSGAVPLLPLYAFTTFTGLYLLRLFKLAPRHEMWGDLEYSSMHLSSAQQRLVCSSGHFSLHVRLLTGAEDEVAIQHVARSSL